MTSVTDLGNSINLRSSEVLSRMVAFGQIASGQDVSIPEAGQGKFYDIKNVGDSLHPHYEVGKAGPNGAWTENTSPDAAAALTKFLNSGSRKPVAGEAISNAVMGEEGTVKLGSYNQCTVTNAGTSEDPNYQMGTRTNGTWTEAEHDHNADGTPKYKDENVQKAYEQFCASGQNLKGGADTTTDMIAGCLVQVGDTVLAGGMVELQAKIDAMLSTVQMSIKKGGQVSQTLQAAARG